MGRTSELSLNDPVNEAILTVSEDRLEGFQPDPVGEISRLSGVPVDTVIKRLRLLLRAGVIRRIRQTLLTHNLADGALVAWELPEEKLHAAFDFMSREDPFSGHVVIRTAEEPGPGTSYRLWTTLKVPRGCPLERHCDFLKERVAAQDYRLMPARAVFVLGVGHLRRQRIAPGTRSDAPPAVMYPQEAQLTDLEWRVLFSLKREFAPKEIVRDIWAERCKQLGLPLDTFFGMAESLAQRDLLGRFSTFLEHTGSSPSGEPTRYNALLQWAMPAGRELEAGQEIGRHPVLTHCYWRDAGPDFGNLNIMGVVHGTSKETVLAHKAAIDRNATGAGFPISYSNILWGERSEIKPSEISPEIYRDWCLRVGLEQPASIISGRAGGQGV